MKNSKQIKKSFMVIGLGRFGANTAKVLTDLGYDILAIDNDEERVADVAEFVNNCVVADATKLNVLEELGVDSIDHAVVAIGHDLQASILALLNLKKLNVRMVSVRADDEEHKEIFTRLGADEVIIPEEAASVSLANQITSDTILDYYPIAEGYSIIKVVVGDDFKPRTIAGLNVRVNFNINILGIFKNDVFSIPKSKDMINPGDRLVLVGAEEDNNKFVEFIS